MHETKQAAARERGSLLVPLGLAHFDEAYRILSDSFPADEIRPYEMQKALLEDPAYRFYGVLDRDSGAVKALLAVYDLDAVIFVEHFAVSADCRNQGLGAKMLRQYLHISTRKMKYLMDYNYIPHINTGKPTHKYLVKYTDARAFKKRLCQDADLQSQLAGHFSSHSKGAPKPAIPLTGMPCKNFSSGGGERCRKHY